MASLQKSHNSKDSRHGVGRNFAVKTQAGTLTGRNGGKNLLRNRDTPLFFK